MAEDVFPQIPEKFLDLFEKRSFAYLATLGANGIPHITPVWIDYDGECLLVNSVKGQGLRIINQTVRAENRAELQELTLKQVIHL